MSIFSKVAFRKPQESRFNMTHGHKLTFNMGELVPFFCEETLPGDRWRLSSQMLVRMAPMIAPVMHEVNVFVHWFFVPNRIIFPEWNNFIYQTKPGYVPPVWPHVSAGGVSGPGSLFNYIGTPVTNGLLTVSALPFMGYQKIWNDFFRDENLEPELNTELVPGNNNMHLGTITQLRKRAWTKDYFTSSLPFAQKGDAVTIPIGADFQDVNIVPTNENIGPNPAAIFRASADGNPLDATNVYADVTTGELRDAVTPTDTGYIDPNGSLKALTSDLELESTTIENLRLSVTMQEWLELAARGGTRPNEASLAFFGVRSSDGRLQRPDFLGGSMNPMVISEVLQTAQGNSEDPTPQGNMAGHGISASSGKFINYFCEEHGFLYGLVSILPKPAYQQGLHRKFTREDKFDYAWPTFANLGEQAVLNQEVFFDADDGLNHGVFGYQSRYAEYKHIMDRVSADFTNSLDYWHMGRIFPVRPGLNGAFVSCDATQRIFAVQDATDKIWAQARFNCSATRKLPKYGIPKFS